MDKNLELKCINTIRLLAVDMVEKAKSGHPGAPIGLAPVVFTLYTKIMKYNPANPNWINRDRFILSAGHASALLYSILHITGYDLSMNELQNFRQWGSKTPGHPEYGHAPGIETTTGPLGQGIATAVGIAASERYLASYFNQPDTEIINNYTYVVCSDGDLMEGISSEAASIAGHLKLGKLICFYDDNKISIEGSTEISFSENVKNRFEAYGWEVLQIDGNDPDSIEEAALLAQKEVEKPTLIQMRTHIGYGSDKQDSASSHGSPLGPESTKKLKENFGFPGDKSFYIPQDVKEFFQEIINQGQATENDWQNIWNIFQNKYAVLASYLTNTLKGKLPENWQDAVLKFKPEESFATRQSSGKVLNSLREKFPLLAGGSADLAPSTGTKLKGYFDFGPAHYIGPNFHFGVREHAMGAIVNGMALSKLIIPFSATFLVFSDYMRPAIRLAALMGIHSIFVFTHDSIGLGEDGPTHQPVEHLAALRSIPNLTVLRPADANETSASWKIAIERQKPVCLVLSRQKLQTLDLEKYDVFTGTEKGAYILEDGGDNPDLILMATGSEVELAMKAYDKLKDEGFNPRIVSMPSWELFEAQSEEYKNKVLPPHIKKRIAIEAGISQGWHKWAGDEGKIIAIDRFGASAPGNIAFEKFGFSVENIIKTAKELK
ncbi:transketolase [Candidatus Margulisiibacteriota bacterium]